MSLFFYSKDEENCQEESINNYKNIFEKYKTNCPTLKEALEQMFVSSGATSNKAAELISLILKYVTEFIQKNFNEIKKNIQIYHLKKVLLYAVIHMNIKKKKINLIMFIQFLIKIW